MELKDRVAIVIGAGQSPGEGVGNGRATALRFCEEGAHVIAADRELSLAEQTCELAEAHPGSCTAVAADVTREADLKALADSTLERFGRIDILHYNVGISVAGNDAEVTEITEEAFDLITRVNLRGAIIAVKHVLPAMRKQQSGVILTISSISTRQRYPWVSYKATKAALVAFTQQLAIENAEHSIRANTILPGLMDTPMAVDTRARAFNRPRSEVAAERDAKVPLGAKMGSGWDVAEAAVFLASDRARYITGVELPVDGGALLNIAR